MLTLTDNCLLKDIMNFLLEMKNFGKFYRYNLERCKICEEKAVLDICAHCEKRACSDCRATHLEMLKRDLTRMLNQV